MTTAEIVRALEEMLSFCASEGMDAQRFYDAVDEVKQRLAADEVDAGR